MLGIRRFHGVAVDLWQGGLELFASDLRVAPTLAGLQAIAAGAEPPRHAAIAIGGEEATATLAMLKAWLEAQPGQAPLRRVTFVLPDGATYRSYQAALFATFADESWA